LEQDMVQTSGQTYIDSLGALGKEICTEFVVCGLGVV
jgi:hypothetical protein